MRFRARTHCVGAECAASPPRARATVCRRVPAVCPPRVHRVPRVPPTLASFPRVLASAGYYQTVQFLFFLKSKYRFLYLLQLHGCVYFFVLHIFTPYLWCFFPVETFYNAMVCWENLFPYCMKEAPGTDTRRPPWERRRAAPWGARGTQAGPPAL